MARRRCCAELLLGTGIAIWAIAAPAPARAPRRPARTPHPRLEAAAIARHVPHPVRTPAPLQLVQASPAPSASARARKPG